MDGKSAFSSWLEPWIPLSWTRTFAPSDSFHYHLEEYTQRFEESIEKYEMDPVVHRPALYRAKTPTKPKKEIGLSSIVKRTSPNTSPGKRKELEPITTVI